MHQRFSGNSDFHLKDNGTSVSVGEGGSLLAVVPGDTDRKGSERLQPVGPGTASDV